MSYTATKTLQPRAFAFPAGFDQTAKLTAIRGTLVENDTATEYTTGGIGSSAFQVTAFSAVGLVTYSSLTGQPLYNGQKVVVFNTSSNTNDGTYIVSQLTPSSASAGTFVALPGPTAIAGSAQTTQTAEGVGQIQFANRNLLPQTFTVTAVTVANGVMTCTYTTLTGPQLTPNDKVILAGMANAANNGQFVLATVTQTSSTGGSFTISTNPGAVASDSGTGTGNFTAGIDAVGTASAPVTPVKVFNSKGYIYKWDATNQTIRIFMTGASSGAVLSEAALGATVAFDNTITFEALFIRAKD